MPCTAPPASWPSTSAGLIARPTSCSTTCRRGTTRPVSGSSETSESVAPKENDGCGLSNRPDTSPASASAIEPSSCARARSARQATATAFPATTVVRLANEPKPDATSPYRGGGFRPRSSSTPSSSAAICARTVSTPWPSEATPTRTTTVPSSATATVASSNGPIAPSSTVAATPIPTCSLPPGGESVARTGRRIPPSRAAARSLRRSRRSRMRSAGSRRRGRRRRASGRPGSGSGAGARRRRAGARRRGRPAGARGRTPPRSSPARDTCRPGVRWVSTACAVSSKASQTYGPGRWCPGRIVGRMPCVRTYAPWSTQAVPRAREGVPSAVAATSISCTWPRAWFVATRCSARSSIHFTGRPRRRAASGTSTSSG